MSPEGKDLISKVLTTDPDDRITIGEIRLHSWYKLYREPTRERGLFPTFQKMSFNESLLDSLIGEYGFEKDYSIKCLEANRHNHITATYHLINKKNAQIVALGGSVSH